MDHITQALIGRALIRSLPRGTILLYGYELDPVSHPLVWKHVGHTADLYQSMSVVCIDCGVEL